MENLPNTYRLKQVLKNYFEEVDGILGVAICDRDGFIIASEFKEGDDEESDSVIGAMSAILDTYIDRIKSEFGTKGSFFNITMMGDKKFAYCSQGPLSILTTVADQSTSDIELKVYSEHIAGKVELILDGNKDVSPKIPEIIRALAKTRAGSLQNMAGEYSHKLILTGDFQVGKSSLIRRFVKNTFEKDYISTIGVQLSKKIVDLTDKIKMNFILWDIGGQIRQMAPYRTKFYNGANAAFIVIDRTREDTMSSVKKWYEDIKNSIPKNIPIVLVGNKSDLVAEIKISEEDIKKVAQDFGFHYILTSAKSGENVNDAFLYIAYRVIETL
ncbi:MAG: GTP-binding protein [Candidatus Lokiarchaeota archaeon]|nr:GTP-binding protein [Candidatus Lokiarchaeota archaeon]